MAPCRRSLNPSAHAGHRPDRAALADHRYEFPAGRRPRWAALPSTSKASSGTTRNSALKGEVAATLLEVDQRNVAGEGRRPANVNRVLPINFCGGPDEIVAQLKEAREQIGCGVVDLSFQTPGSEHPDELVEALELFGKKVLPHIRDV